MKKLIIVCSIALAIVLVLGAPRSASAHETHIYKIGDQYYKFVVGSLNEPVTVDDATGVELRVNHSRGPHDTEAPSAVAGLDQTIKVELGAGAKTKTLDLRPKFGEQGVYTAKFYPTVETTYTYQFFGTLDDVPINLSFSCNPAGHPQGEEDKTEVPLTSEVIRTLKRGAFGCPTAKADLGFPEPSTSLYDASLRIALLDQRLSGQTSTTRAIAILAIVIGLVGIFVSVRTRMKMHKR